MKLIIDCDTGIDDTHALILALKSSHSILGITCVAGNVELENVCCNNLYLLTQFGRVNEVPLFPGCSKSLLGVNTLAPHIHGKCYGYLDTLNVPKESLKTEHAVDALVRLANQNKGEISLVTLGPLTNIAMALRLDPEFRNNLKEVFIMGGNMKGMGNVTVSSEFNFHADPEAAYIVMNEIRSPIFLVPWEVCRFQANEFLTKEWFDNWMQSFPNTPPGNLLRELSRFHRDELFTKRKESVYRSCDGTAMLCCLERSAIVTTSSVYCTVELHGKHTRGQCVIDWESKHFVDRPNVILVESVNPEMVRRAMDSLAVWP